MSFTAASVMDRAAAFLNDVALTNFTYAAQIPYLNIALDDLQELFEENNIPITNKRSAVLAVPVGTSSISFGGTPALPADLVEIQDLGERTTGTTDNFAPMSKVDFLPMTSVLTNELIYWAWIGELIKFLGANSNRDVQINYIGSVFAAVAASTDNITAINGKSFLAYRTAALCAEFIGENPERAESLNNNAVMALSRSLNISTKGRQGMVSRRRPFMSSYRNRGVIF